jgi:hypothetical protein
LGASSLVVALSLGCFFELADVEPLPVGIGGSGDAGSGAGGSGGALTAGNAGDGASAAAGSAGVPACPSGQKDCGSGCEPYAADNGCGSELCAPCAPLPQADLTCNGETNLCQFDVCRRGFADCDGDASGYPEAAGNGCEYSFTLGSEIRTVVTQPLQVPLASITIGDDSRDDWAGVPVYPLSETCDNCVDTALPDVIFKNEVPSRRDLDAYYRVAWNEDSFFVLGDVFDDANAALGADVGQCQNGSLCEDALTVFFDGRNNRNTPGNDRYGIDDLRVFVGLGGKAFRVSGAPVAVPQEVDFKVTKHSEACYRIEARFAWSYITGAQNLQPIPGQFPAAEGQQYGFDISVNDWDLSVSNQTPSRESQLFWVNPGAEYQNVTTGFGAMTLVNDVPLLSAPQ